MDITVGGEDFYLRVVNECSITASNFGCDIITAAAYPLQSDFHTKMTDHGNGIYTATYNLKLNGTVTLYVYMGKYAILIMFWHSLINICNKISFQLIAKLVLISDF